MYWPGPLADNDECQLTIQQGPICERCGELLDADCGAGVVRSFNYGQLISVVYAKKSVDCH
jgi:hypothetical protein